MTMGQVAKALLALATVGLGGGCGGGGSGGPCTPATFTAHPTGSTFPCSSGEAGFFRASVRVGSSTGTQKIPITRFGPDGDDFRIVGDGQDANVLTINGHSEVFVCGYQGPGEYFSTGAGSSLVQVRTSQVEPVYRSAPDSECTVCINPDGTTGDFLCHTLRVDGSAARDTMEASGSFAAP